ncbi:hypothetical protein KIN20_025374 [Parelaphostrongylus tenuis]|uniref:G-protein coupled receptors family 1 profile domain-containing protein n=1 Tax=Parelaphostrongylus tenuis TaxID=148309 RepID=A0AAD5NAR2_PARTN|nr:hypothetical protein KIN20_025374 [Parelaphostrongylus tenuis]
MVNGYFTTALVILGTIGNVHGVRRVLITNLDKKRGVALAVSLIALAIWDTILLWCAFFYYAIRKLPIAISSDRLNILMPWFHPFSQIANTAATWCVVAITWQRFMATRDPFRTSRSSALVRSFRNERRMSFLYCSGYRRLLRMPIALSIGAILLNVPAFFELYNYLCYKQEENRIAISVRPTELRLKSGYALYRLISRMIVVSIGPNLGILILTLLTVFMLRGSNRTRRQLFQMNENFLDRNASREILQTLISIMLVSKFLCFRSLTFVLDLVEVTVGVHNYYLVDVSNFLVLLNSATNSLVFLKASSWMNKRFLEKKTMTRKRPSAMQVLHPFPSHVREYLRSSFNQFCRFLVDLQSRQLLSNRLNILSSSWQQALSLNNGNPGVRILYSILRRQPTLFAAFKTPSLVPYVNEKVEAEMLALFANGSTWNVNVLTNAKFMEIAERITAFIGELLQMMKDGKPDEYIVVRIRRVGAVHFQHHLHFPSTVWREFKSTITGIISECEFRSSDEREAALDAWNIFTSFIIREMKMGTWAMGDTLANIS